MFTGLIQATGQILALRRKAQGLHLTVDVSGLPERPEIGASIAVNGCCLTVTAMSGAAADFDAVEETVALTNLPGKQPGERVNLEPALRHDGRIDGHFVLGHVDCTGRLLDIAPSGLGQYWRFSLPAAIAPLVALKGSVAVDGISLTVAEADRESFRVSLIPHTIAHTALAGMRPGTVVNLEADVLARYLARRMEFLAPASPISSADPHRPSEGGLSEAFLRENGF